MAVGHFLIMQMHTPEALKLLSGGRGDFRGRHLNICCSHFIAVTLERVRGNFSEGGNRGHHVRLHGMFKGLENDSRQFTSVIIKAPLFQFEQRFVFSSALRKSSQI